MFRVSLDCFHGPVDLLLHLVRRQELDVNDVPIAGLIDQFLAHVEVLEVIDMEMAGEFLDLASVLIEIKSRSVLPTEAESEEQPIETVDEGRANLVRRLLEYQKYREAARELEARSTQWGDRFARQANDLTGRTIDPAEQPIHGVELWDLVSALGRVMKARLKAPQPHKIVYDETPIEAFMQRIHQRLTVQPSLAFESLFPERVHKSTLVGMFLAVLELVRRGYARATQPERFGGIHLELGDVPLPEGFAGPTLSLGKTPGPEPVE
ncbi:Segregation and condensation protein A [Pirellulimonas nuda]|uniref:Segregation and condensation protein A n=1 Tax=Pirellulimonas nuda TaxID=2528009 RepID=A0A518D5P7_9BACT|nr:segregation/condensation protein A [Pirellulimonas nuda]QDU86802.1 Segregation and condensation protein A [Pirellulimonas nuda]